MKQITCEQANEIISKAIFEDIENSRFRGIIYTNEANDQFVSEGFSVPIGSKTLFLLNNHGFKRICNFEEIKKSEVLDIFTRHSPCGTIRVVTVEGGDCRTLLKFKIQPSLIDNFEIFQIT